MLSEQVIAELNQLFGLTKSTRSCKLRYRWVCPILAQEIGNFSIVPLVTSKQLASEGWHMQHCVAAYDANCAKGLYQVFSIRDLLGSRLATLGLTYGASGWKVDQCFGVGNATVMCKSIEWINDGGKNESMLEYTDLHYLAQEMARLLNARAEE